MKLRLERFASDDDCTRGLLFVDGVFAAFTLEDEYRLVKVPHETRIPAGDYRIIPHPRSRWVPRLEKRFGPRLGRYALLVDGVPGFAGILIHPGNTDEHTSGCLLVGNTCLRESIGDSRSAYRALADVVMTAIDGGEEVQIEIIDRDLPRSDRAARAARA